MRIRRVCNVRKCMTFLKNKAMFNNFYFEYVRRDWLDVSSGSFDEFKDFVAEHPRFFIKPREGSLGTGSQNGTPIPAKNSAAFNIRVGMRSLK